MITASPSAAKKLGLEETWKHECGCVMRKDENIWVKYRSCKEHEKKEKDEKIQ